MYNVKIYDRSRVFKDTLEIDRLEDISDFTSEINGGFGTLSIGIATSITDTQIEYTDIIEVQYKKDIIYVGSVLSINKVYGSKKEFIQINLIGFASLMSTLIMSMTYTDTASNIVKNLIDTFNIEYGSNILSYTALSIPDSVGNISVDFSSYKKYLDCMKEVAEISGLDFFIDINGLVTFGDSTCYNSHTLTVGKDVDEIVINEDGSQVINSLRVKYSGGAQTYENAPSQAIYGKKETIIDKSSEISDEPTALIFSNSYFEKYKDKIKKVSIIVNNAYTFFDIKAGDRINVRNIGYQINNLQVAKVNYGLDNAKIELEIAYSFAKQVFNG